MTQETEGKLQGEIFYNKQVQVRAYGLAVDPDRHEAYYLSAAGSKNAIRSLWATANLPNDQAPQLAVTGWYAGKFTGNNRFFPLKQFWARLPGTSLQHGVLETTDPSVIFLVDPQGARYADSFDPAHLEVRRTLRVRKLPMAQRKLIGFLQRETEVPVLPEWGEMLWEAAVKQPGALLDLQAFGDCVGAWRISRTFGWLAFVQQMLARNQLDIPLENGLAWA